MALNPWQHPQSHNKYRFFTFTPRPILYLTFWYRLIVGDMAGLTRDAIHVEWTHKARHFRYYIEIAPHTASSITVHYRIIQYTVVQNNVGQLSIVKCSTYQCCIASNKAVLYCTSPECSLRWTCFADELLASSLIIEHSILSFYLTSPNYSIVSLCYVLHLFSVYRLVDTAGLTRIRTDKSLLLASKERRKMRIESNIGKNVRVTQRSGSSTYSAVELPGIQLLDPEADPSQFSHQVHLTLPYPLFFHHRFSCSLLSFISLYPPAQSPTLLTFIVFPFPVLTSPPCLYPTFVVLLDQTLEGASPLPSPLFNHHECFASTRFSY